MKKIKEDENGRYSWVDCGQGSGYWFQEWNEELAKERPPVVCPACKQGFDRWSTAAWYRNQVCSDCSILYLEDRELPEWALKNRDTRLEYVKQKIAEKNSSK